MPPGIKCRTCKIARQTLFIEPVKDDDADKNTVSYARIFVAIVAIGIIISLW